mmetsp:Transcript_52576/g.72882  ORF Transcript_52576/g.72882 Transcript_52576/m.72882 type:complete len:254 (+) Transcript_52576:425-1186(+)
MTMEALLPPSSRRERPKRSCTTHETLRPTAVDPVKEMRGRRGSAAMRAPTSAPVPWATARTPGGTPLRSRTSATIFEVATVVSGMVSAPFQRLQLPHIMEMEAFQPKTATGKLNAVIMPHVPSGFQHSSSMWPSRSEGSTWPAKDRLRPAAMSQTSTNSWTSPMPSALILPISSVISFPSGSIFSRSARPIWRTISPRLGAGVSAQAASADLQARMHRSRSSGVACATRAMGLPVAGQVLVYTSPLANHSLPS